MFGRHYSFILSNQLFISLRGNLRDATTLIEERTNLRTGVLLSTIPMTQGAQLHVCTFHSITFTVLTYNHSVNVGVLVKKWQPIKVSGFNPRPFSWWRGSTLPQNGRHGGKTMPTVWSFRGEGDCHFTFPPIKFTQIANHILPSGVIRCVSRVRCFTKFSHIKSALEWFINITFEIITTKSDATKYIRESRCESINNIGFATWWIPNHIADHTAHESTSRLMQFIKQFAQSKRNSLTSSPP